MDNEQKTSTSILSSATHIRDVAIDYDKYVLSRMMGKNPSLKTGWAKFNDICGGGIEANTIYTFAGMSGSGKSLVCNIIETDLFKYNDKEEIAVLSFSWEMVGLKQIGRKVSKELCTTVAELYSNKAPLAKDKFEKSREYCKKLSELPIWYIETPCDARAIFDTIIEFAKVHKGKKIVVFIDHLALASGAYDDNERVMLGNIQKAFIAIKNMKWFNKTIIQLSQLNRKIEGRLTSTLGVEHYPQKQDIYGADTIFFASDYVIVLMVPEGKVIRNEYGAQKYPCEGKVFMHILKNRDGEEAILQFDRLYQFNNIIG